MKKFFYFRLIAFLCIVTFSLSMRAEVEDNYELLAQTRSKSRSGKAAPSKPRGYNPPLEFTAEEVENTFFVIDNEFVEFPQKRTTIVCKLHPGGQISGTYKVTNYHYPDVTIYDYTPEEYVSVNREISGKWSTSYRSMGNGREKCYAIDMSFLNNTLYLPSNGDYLFKSWINCEDNNTGYAFKVLSIKNL